MCLPTVRAFSAHAQTANAMVALGAFGVNPDGAVRAETPAAPHETTHERRRHSVSAGSSPLAVKPQSEGPCLVDLELSLATTSAWPVMFE
jgi:hypothetical protein